VVAVVRNSKSWLVVSMNLLSRLKERDVRVVSQDRNILGVFHVTTSRKVVIDK